MARVIITEYERLAAAPGADSPQIPGTPAITSHIRTIVATSVISAVFRSQTRIVHLSPDQACSVKFGPSAATTATPADHRMCTGLGQYFGVQPSSLVAVITTT